MSTWLYYGSSPDGSKFDIEGLNVWAHEWPCERDSKRALGRDPLYDQEFSFQIWSVDDGKKKVRFAADEF